MAKSKTINLPIFRVAHEARLIAEAKANLGRYERNSPWAEGRNAAKTCVDSNFTVPGDLASRLKNPTAKNSYDIENAITLHKSLSGLSRRDASDPLLWARLCHVELWRYMRRRFDVAKQKDDRKVRLVLSRYFVPQNNSRALMRNGLARLWWAGFLTHDNNATGAARYLLTEVLLKRLDITKNLLERSYGRSPKVLKTVLRFIHAKKAELLAAGDVCRKRSRQLFRRLNELGGVSLLDELSEADITAFLDSTLAVILKSEASGTGKKKSPVAAPAKKIRRAKRTK